MISDQVFSRTSSRGRDNSVNKSIIRYIIKDNLLARAVDGEGFKNLIKDFSRFCNSIEYWMRQEDDSLKPLALKYLIIPATSVPCERLSSKAGDVITAKRSLISKTRLQKFCIFSLSQLKSSSSNKKFIQKASCEYRSNRY